MQIEKVSAVGKLQEADFSVFRLEGDHFLIGETMIKLNVPLILEYDFLKEKIDASQILDISIKASVKIRFYQERALQNIFIDQKARSGLVILPCGSGKTIVGIAAIARIKRSAIIICDSDISVEQWHDELLKCTNINER